MEKLYTYDKDGNWARVTAETKAKLIATDKRKESQFISETDYLRAKDTPPSEYLAVPIYEGTNKQESNVFNRESERKLELINTLRRLYKGDIQGVVDAIVDERKPKFSDTNQRELYEAVYNILSARDTQDLNKLADSDNRYLKFISNVHGRKGLYTDEEGDYRQPTGGEVAFPNFSERQGEGAGSKVVGALHDVFTLPTRGATAAVSMLSPYGDQLSFSQQMARPVGASTGPENFVDFAVSGTPTGSLIAKGVGKVGGYLRKAEPLSKAVRDMSKVNRGLGETMARGAARGAGEGAAYSLEPAAVLATSPQEESPWATFGEGMALGTLAGAGMGAGLAGGKSIGSKLVGKYDPDALPDYGRELLIPKESLRRLQTAAQKEPLKDAAMIETEYADVLAETKKAFEDKLGSSRRQAINDINEQGVFGVPDKQLLSDDAVVLDFVERLGEDPAFKSFLESEKVQKLPQDVKAQVFRDATKDLLKVTDKVNTLGRYSKEFFGGDQVDGILRKLPVDLEPVALKEWARIRRNLGKDVFDMKNVEEEITRLNLLGSRTTDPSKQHMYKEFADRLRAMEEKIADDFQIGTSDQRLPEIRKDFQEAYSVMEKLPEPDRLIQSAASRLRPSTSSEFKRLIEAEKALNNLRGKYELPKTDILTTPVAAIVRGRVPVGKVDDPTLAQVIERAGRGPVRTGLRGAGALLGGFARGTTKGQVADAVLSDEEFTNPPQVFDMLMKDGSSKVVIPYPKKK